MKIITRIKPILFGCALLQLCSPLTAEEHYDEAQQAVVSLSKQQIKVAGIKVSPVRLTKIPMSTTAPARIVFNRYKTASITPRISSQLVKRHVSLGDTVEKGQAIVSLSSVEMAEAQGKLLLSHREWFRVKKLGPNIITEKRYTQSHIDWQLAKARAIAYGMSAKQIMSFVKTEDFSKANGLFTLTSPINGTVLEEAYILGQQIESGSEINLITNESSLWALANVSPQLAHDIDIGNSASITVGEYIFPAKVVQISHRINDATRTHEVRLSVENKQDDLHSGLFVEAEIQLSNELSSSVLTVPESALLRGDDGDWLLMVQQEHSTEFKGVEVTVKQVFDGIAVVEGVDPNTAVVSKGAFFVQSELGKNSFEIHNH